MRFPSENVVFRRQNLNINVKFRMRLPSENVVFRRHNLDLGMKIVAGIQKVWYDLNALPT